MTRAAIDGAVLLVLALYVFTFTFACVKAADAARKGENDVGR